MVFVFDVSIGYTWTWSQGPPAPRSIACRVAIIVDSSSFPIYFQCTKSNVTAPSIHISFFFFVLVRDLCGFLADERLGENKSGEEAEEEEKNPSQRKAKRDNAE